MKIRNKIRKIVTGIGLVAMLLAPSKLNGEQNIQTNEPNLTLSTRTDFLSKYIFRGFTYSKGPVIQQFLTLVPNIPIKHGGLSVTGLGNYDFETRKFNEADVFVDYSKQIGDITLLTGWGYFSFPGTQIKETQELYVGLSVNTLLKPSVKAVYDYIDGKGLYGELSVAHDFNLNSKFIPKDTKLTLNTILGYNHRYYRDDNSFSHIQSRADVVIPLTKRITMVPGIAYSKSLDKTFEDEIFGGVKIEINF